MTHVSNWRTSWRTNWLFDWLTNWLSNWLTNWLSNWLCNCLSNWLSSWRTNWRTCLIDTRIYWPQRKPFFFAAIVSDVHNTSTTPFQRLFFRLLKVTSIAEEFVWKEHGGWQDTQISITLPLEYMYPTYTFESYNYVWAMWHKHVLW